MLQSFCAPKPGSLTCLSRGHRSSKSSITHKQYTPHQTTLPHVVRAHSVPPASSHSQCSQQRRGNAIKSDFKSALMRRGSAQGRTRPPFHSEIRRLRPLSGGPALATVKGRILAQLPAKMRPVSESRAPSYRKCRSLSTARESANYPHFPL